MFHKALLSKSMTDHLRGIVGWALGVAAIVVIQLSVYPTIRSSSSDWSSLIDAFPDAFKEIIRINDYTSETGYLTTELMSFVVPFIFIGLGCSWGARVTTEDEESGFADIAIALPISRASYLVSRFGASLTVMLITTTSFLTTTIIGARLLGMSISVSKFLAGGTCLFLLGTLAMSLASLIGSITGARASALGLSMAFAIGSFLVYSLAPLVDFLDATMPINMFDWTIGTTPLFDGFDWAKMMTTAAISMICALTTFYFFDKRNISG